MADQAAAGRLTVPGSGFGTGSGPASGTCPCGGVPRGAALSACCGPVVSGERTPTTAEALMRSRYTAYALGAGDHLFRTWHPRTRPDDTRPDPRVRWEGLEVVAVGAGSVDDTEGVVEFRARWVSVDDGPVRRGELHERSRFVRRAGRWVYLDGG
ncbi:YchJ family protein [Fodinibacter luteus]|uniref:YchJ family protein n=1 Tax=Fodinibacter luteus TaxID=552064 RepID=A0ABP8KRJ8_9MICO